MSVDLASFAVGVAAAFLASGLAFGVLMFLSRPKRRPRVPVQQMPPAVLLTPQHRPRKRRA